VDERTITTCGSIDWKLIEAREGEWCRVRIEDGEFICKFPEVPPEAEVIEVSRGWCVRVCDRDDGIDDTLMDWTGVFAGEKTAVDYMVGLLEGVHG
jgi:hypothetical protein